MIRCYQCGKETEPRFPGAVRGLCPECTTGAAGNLAAAPPTVPASAPVVTADAGSVAEPVPATEIFAAEPPSRPLVTYVLVGVTSAIFVLMTAAGVSPISPDAQQVVNWGANYGLMTLGGQWWRLFTSIFLHFGILHLALNMWCLWYLGSLAERVMSRTSFLMLYMYSGLGGSILSLAWHPLVISAGASGAIFGLAGGLASLFYLKKVPMPAVAVKKLQGSIASFLVYNLAYGVLKSGIDMAAHLGGLVTGLVMGAMLTEGEGTPRVRVLGLPAGGIGMLLLIGGALGAVHVQRPIADLGVAERLIQNGQPEKAAEILGKVVAEKPDLATAHFLLGNAYLHSAKNDKAAAEYLKALGLDSDNFAYRINLAVAYLRMEQPSPALAQLNQVLSKDPEDLTAQSDAALAYYEMKNYDQALAAADKALAHKANDANAYWVKGEAYLGKKDAGQAIEAFQKALAIDAKDASAQQGLCRAYWQQNNLEQAKACFQRFVDQHPDSESARKNLEAVTQAEAKSPRN